MGIILEHPYFIAVIHSGESEQIVEKIMAGRTPNCISRYDLAEGYVTLYIQERKSINRTILVTLNKTKSGTEIPLGIEYVDTGNEFDEFKGRARQYCSYLFLDKRRRAVFWTDHIGVSKIFYATVGRCQVFSDDLKVFGFLGLHVDQGMVASFLANGSMLPGRTILANVGSLAPSSIITVSPRGLDARRYWTFEPGSDLVSDQEELGQELWARTKAAVSRHVGESPIILPLSGGYDSSCLLGLLSESGKNIRTFSYVHGPPHKGSDADVALRQAKLMDTEHRTIKFDDVNLLAMLKENIRAGQYQRHPSYEISVFAKASELAEGNFQDAQFCLGDESFGWSSFRLNDSDDLLGSIELKAARCLSEIEPVTGMSVSENLQNILEREYKALIDLIPSCDSQDDAKDWLYYNVRVVMNLAPLRVHSAGHYLPFICPFLDTAALDMMRYLSSDQRRDKRLFKNIVRQRLPEIFRIPRARSDQASPDLNLLMRTERAQIKEYISGLSIGIPDVLTSDELREFFEICLRPRNSLRPEIFGRNSVRSFARTAAKTVLSYGIVPSVWQGKLRRRSFNKFFVTPSREEIFLRALQLAEVFEGMQPR